MSTHCGPMTVLAALAAMVCVVVGVTERQGGTRVLRERDASVPSPRREPGPVFESSSRGEACALAHVGSPVVRNS